MISAPNLNFLSQRICKVTGSLSRQETDLIAVEEPLEIRLAYGTIEQREVKNISVTMRTPGHDTELAVGFLFTEGIISSANDIKFTETRRFRCGSNKENTIQVELNESVIPNIKNIDRNFYTTSSCGVCGKGSIAAIKTVSSYVLSEESESFTISYELLNNLPALLYQKQDVFHNTGGLHACALFNEKAELILLKEDVGRHNALDKVIGLALQMELLPLNRHIILLSGRASFELIQKAAMAGVVMVAAIGAPSSLAVSLAAEFNMTLIGFLREGRFNIYTHPERIKTVL